MARYQFYVSMGSMNSTARKLLFFVSKTRLEVYSGQFSFTRFMPGCTWSSLFVERILLFTAYLSQARQDFFSRVKLCLDLIILEILTQDKIYDIKKLGPPQIQSKFNKYGPSLAWPGLDIGICRPLNFTFRVHVRLEFYLFV